jgi:hypothetical protein
LSAGATSVSHTTHASAKSLIVAVGVGKQVSSTTGSTTGVTFNGVAMTQVPNSPQIGSTGTTNTTSNGRSGVSLWTLTETGYGGTLGGVTGDIVVTRNDTPNLLSWAYYDLDCEVVVEASAFKALTSGDEGVLYECGYTAAPGDGMTTGEASFVIGVIADIGDGASALTHSWTGLTEDFDGGGVNAGRTAQFSAASASFAGDITQEDISCSTSAITGGALIVTAFRRGAGGE